MTVEGNKRDDWVISNTPFEESPFLPIYAGKWCAYHTGRGVRKMTEKSG